MLYVRSVPVRDRADLTAKAVIRDEALRLFAEAGPDRVTVRQVAAAAGVSPGLVMHHYGSRQGLRDAVDTHVAGVFDAMFTQLGDLDWDGDAASFAEMVTSSLPAGSPIPGYLRRLLTDGGPVAEDLFARWFAAGRAVLEALTRAGVARPVGDPDVAAAFLMVNDLALLLLRDQLTAALGIDPLTPQGMARWVETVMDIYRGGIFAAPAAQATAETARSKRGHT
jgi:AcrR family transcriptional regulator